MKPPISAFQETKGMVYFARMLDKIRKFQSSELREDFHDNLGVRLDGRCVDYLRVDYKELVKRTLDGGTDEEILKWCFEQGRELNEGDIMVWNQFATKLGWRDGVTKLVATRKKEITHIDPEEIQTMFEYFEYDEGRK